MLELKNINAQYNILHMLNAYDLLNIKAFIGYASKDECRPVV